MPKSRNMTDAELLEVVKRKLDGNLPFHTTELNADRTKALRMYRGEAFGLLAKQEGKSGVISRDVAEVVDTVLPDLMRVFASGDQTVIYEPVGPEDEQGAEQATDYANLVWSKDNPGFSILHSWLKDGLLQRNGVVKVYWDERERQTRQEYQNLDDGELAALKGEPGVEVIEEEQGEEGWNLAIRRTSKRGKITIKNVPPEEMISDLEYPGLDADCPFCAHHYRSCKSDLIADGFDRKLVETIPTQESAPDETTERAERLKPEYSGVSSEATSDAMAPIWVAECYVRVDFDGDGYAELRQIVVGGDQADVILRNKEVDDNVFADWTPYPMPHKRYGESLADKTIDIQEAKSALWRQGMDNLYLVNMPQTEIVENQVNVEQALNRRPGGIITVKAPGQLREIMTPPAFQHAFKGLEYLDTVREKRTGVTAYNQGLDANSLNKTATGINAIMGAANKRSELLARVFAETGLTRAFKLILKLAKQHQDKPRTVRLRGKWVPVDPSTWNADMDATVTVGLGNGNKDQAIAHATNLFGIQKAFLEGGKASMVSDENLFATAELYVKASDLKQTEKYFTDPSTVPPEARQPPPDPKMIEAQAKAQLAQQDAQTKAQIGAMDAQHQAQLKAQQAEQDMALKQRQADQDFANRQREHEQQMAMERDKAMLAQQMEVERAQHQAQLSEFDVGNKAKLAERDQTESLRMKARSAGVEAKIASLLEEPGEEPEDDMDAKVAEGMNALADAVRAQGEGMAQVLSQLAQGQAAIGDGMRAMAEQMARPRRVVRGNDGKAVGVEAV